MVLTAFFAYGIIRLLRPDDYGGGLGLLAGTWQDVDRGRPARRLAERPLHVPEEARHGEDVLHEHHVGDHERRRGAEQRRDGDVGHGHGVPAYHARMRKALRSRRADEVLAHRIDRQRLREPQDCRRQRRPDDEPRHEHRAQEIPRILQRRRVGVRVEEERQLDEPERRGEQQQREEADDVRRRAEEDHRGGFDRARAERSRPRGAPGSAEHPEPDPDDHPAREQEQVGPDAVEPHPLQRRAAEEHARLAEVEVQQRAADVRPQPAERRLARVELRPQQADDPVGEERGDDERCHAIEQPTDEEPQHGPRC